MVCVRMGLLDDAIRDQLELKRRRGADPGEVAREQREALDAPGGSGEGAAPDSPIEPAGNVAPELSDDQPERAPAYAGGSASAAGASGGETAEIDMQEVLADDHAGGGEKAWPAPDSIAAPDAQTASEDVLEETPDFLRET